MISAKPLVLDMYPVAGPTRTRFEELSSLPQTRPDLITSPEVVAKILQGKIVTPLDPNVLKKVEAHYKLPSSISGKLLVDYSPRDLRPHLTAEIQKIQKTAREVFRAPRGIRGVVDLFSRPNHEISQSLTDLKEALLTGNKADAERIYAALPGELKEVIQAPTRDRLLYCMDAQGRFFIDQLIDYFTPKTAPTEEPSPLIQRCSALIERPPEAAPSGAGLFDPPLMSLEALQKGIDTATRLQAICSTRSVSGHITDYEGYRREIHILNEVMEYTLYPKLIARLPGAAPLIGEHPSDYEWRIISNYPDLLATSSLLPDIIANFTRKKEALTLFHAVSTLDTSAAPAIRYYLIDPLMQAERTLPREQFDTLCNQLLAEIIRTYRNESPPVALPASPINLSPLRVLIVATECKHIWMKGGLGTYTQEIAEGLQSSGHQVTILLPDFAHRATAAKIDDLVLRHRFNHKDFDSDVKSERLGNIVYHTIQDNGEYALYDLSSGTPYDDRKEERFLHFSSAVAAYIEAKKRDFDTVILNDWHVGFVPELLARRHSEPFFKGDFPRFLYMIHNAGLAAQGWFKNTPLVASAGISAHAQRSSVESALQFADEAATVSPQYAKELIGGAGDRFVPLLKKRWTQGNFRGLMNGVTMSEPPTGDNLYDIKQAAAAELQAIIRAHYPQWHHIDFANKEILLYVGRYDSTQKGLHRLKHALKAAHDMGAVFICMGNHADQRANHLLDELEALAYGKEAMIVRDSGTYYYQNGHDAVPGIGELARKAATIGVYVSDYEPCGLVQLEAFKYGTAGCYTQVGGFVDSFTADSGTPLNEYDLEAGFRERIAHQQAMRPEEKEVLYRRIRAEGFQKFSWTARIQDYTTLLAAMRKPPSADAPHGGAGHE